MWRWLAWALINCACFSIEIIVVHFMAPRVTWLQRLKRSGDGRKYEWLVSFFGAFGILALIVANMAIMFGFENTPKFLYLLLVPVEGSLLYSVVALCSIILLFTIGVRAMRIIENVERNMTQQTLLVEHDLEQ